MSRQTWEKIATLTHLMAEGLLARGIDQAACAYDESVDRDADAWIRRWIGEDPTLQMPTDPLVARVILARCRYACADAQILAMQGKPLPSPSVDATLGIYLIDLWYHHYRSNWLGGERGVAPSEN